MEDNWNSLEEDSKNLSTLYPKQDLTNPQNKTFEFHPDTCHDQAGAKIPASDLTEQQLDALDQIAKRIAWLQETGKPLFEQLRKQINRDLVDQEIEYMIDEVKSYEKRLKQAARELNPAVLAALELKR